MALKECPKCKSAWCRFWQLCQRCGYAPKGDE